MAEFITYVEPGSFEIDFKTTDYSEYRDIEEAARAIIDRHTDTHASGHVSMDKHHNKTYAQDFLEKFPNAGKSESDRPYFCRAQIYGDELECPNGGCKKCWNEVMPDA